MKKILLSIMSLIILMVVVFVSTDVYRVKNDKAPIFVIHTKTDELTNNEYYYGLFYKVVKYNVTTVTPETKNPKLEPYYKINVWFK